MVYVIKEQQAEPLVVQQQAELLFVEQCWNMNHFFFKFYFIFKLYIIVLVLPNIKMNHKNHFF